MAGAPSARDRWRPLPGLLGRALGSPVLDAVAAAIGVGLLVLVLVAGFAGTQSPLDNFAPTLRLHHLLGRAGVRERAVRRIFAGAQPVARDRPPTSWACARSDRQPLRHRPIRERLGRWPAAAGLLASPGSSSRRGGASTRGRSPSRCSATRRSPSQRRRSSASTRGPAAARRSPSTSTCSRGSRRSSGATARVGLRPPLAGLPRLDAGAGHRRAAARHDRHRHLRRPQPGHAVDGPDGRRASATRRRWSQPIGIGARRRAGRAPSTRSGLPGRSVGGDLDAGELRRAFVHSLVPIALVYVAAHYLTLPALRGPVDRLPGLRPARRGLGPVRHRQRGDRLRRRSARTAWYLQVGLRGRRATWPRSCSPTTARSRSTPSRGSRCARSTGCSGVMVGFTTLALWLLAAAQG